LAVVSSLISIESHFSIGLLMAGSRKERLVQYKAI
jgi:hypothetical protein